MLTRVLCKRRPQVSPLSSLCMSSVTSFPDSLANTLHKERRITCSGAVAACDGAEAVEALCCDACACIGVLSGPKATPA